MKPPHLTFRTAGPADVTAVVDLVESAYRGDPSRAGWTTEADLLDGRRTGADEVAALVAEVGSEIVLAFDATGLQGCCHLRDEGTDAYFGLFAVRPDGQGAGTGRALLLEAAARAARWRCSAVRMTVIRQRPELIAWYRRLGFDAVGRTEPFPYGDERFGRPRRPDLEFVVLSAPVARLLGGSGPADTVS
ncbi:MAG TPA: GNAT family N-acetyltransferase [Acidimicrobiales bacterium]|nr:GNAT family N-acetyltransferase [Acidimicrobiales bacterium]